MSEHQKPIEYLITYLTASLPFIITKGDINLLICTPNYRSDPAMQSHLFGMAESGYPQFFHARKSFNDTQPAITCWQPEASGRERQTGSFAEQAQSRQATVTHIIGWLFEILHDLPIEPALIFSLKDCHTDHDALQSADCAVTFSPPQFAFAALLQSHQAFASHSYVPEKIVETHLTLKTGLARLCLYGFEPGFRHTAALIIGNPENSPDPVLLRLHSECFTGDIFASRRCDCGYQLNCALDMIMSEGQGVILYLPQEGRGVGLPAKLHAYCLQDEQGLDTVDANCALGFRADNRNFSFAAAILQQLQIHKVRLLTHNPKKIEALQNAGIAVFEHIVIHHGEHEDNHRYLDTKRRKLHHKI